MFDRFVRAPRLLAALLLTAVAACGESDDESGRACDFGFLCLEYGAGAALDQRTHDSLKASCEEDGSRWVANCTTANLLGTCQDVFLDVFQDAPVEVPRMTAFIYLGVHESTAEAEESCAGWSGTWTSAPPIPQGAAVQTVVACDARQDPYQGTCFELSGMMTPERQAGLRTACTSMMGGVPLASGACPAATHGKCTSPVTATITSVENYYDAATAAEDRTFCAADGGTWSSGDSVPTPGPGPVPTPGSELGVPVYGACHQAALGFCYEYGEASRGRVEAPCAQGGGAWVDACPDANTLGVCVWDLPELGRSATHFYLGLSSSEADGKALCTGANGTWSQGSSPTPGPTTPSTVACDLRDSPPWTICSEMSGPMFAEQRAALAASCTSVNGGTLLSQGATCPASGRTGTCSAAYTGGLTSLDHFYDPARAAKDEADCRAGGHTWTPG